VFRAVEQPPAAATGASAHQGDQAAHLTAAAQAAGTPTEVPPAATIAPTHNQAQPPQYQGAPPPGWGDPGSYGVRPASGEHARIGLDAGLAQGFRQERFTTEVKPQPRSGWRKAVLTSTFGLINLGESKIERIDRERGEKIMANIPRTEFIFAVMGPRGGVSKTTTTAAIGSMFARLRGAEVVVIDADPNDGNLASRVNPEATHTFADVLADKRINGVNDIRSYTRRNAAQLDVLAGCTKLVNPAVYNRETLLNTINVLRSGYRIIGIDCGQNLGDELFSAVLDVATALVIVTGDQIDSAESALKHYDRLGAHGRSELRNRSFLLISDRSPKPNKLVRNGIENLVSTTVWKDPAHVPFDEHLHEAGVINLGLLQKATFRSYLEATARLASWYGLPPIPLPPGRRS